MSHLIGGTRTSALVIGGVATAALMLCAGRAAAGLVVLGNSGWTASWAPALDPFLEIHLDGEAADTVIVEKTAEFTGAPAGGIFPSLDVVFTQTSAVAAHNIIITDEIIVNHTGSPWSDFHMDILGNPPTNVNVAFDPAASAGFSIAPFTASNFASSNTVFNVFGGTVPNGGIWFPGVAAGQLAIHVNTLSLNQTFTLRETPTPAPGAIALLAMSAIFGAPRRRRA